MTPLKVEIEGMQPSSAMILAVSTWSFHIEFLNRDRSGFLPELFPRLARRVLGVRSIEFFEGDYAPQFLDKQYDDDYARRIRRACDDEGVRISCIAAVNDLTDDKGFETNMERLRKWGQHCAILECPNLRVNTGRNKLSADSVKLLITRLEQLLAQIVNKQLLIVLENHPHALMNDSDVELFLRIVRHFHNGRVRVCADVGAMGPGYWRRGFQLLAPFASHVHLKPTVLEVGPDGGVKELQVAGYGPEIRRILDKNCYHGALSIEFTEFRDLNADPYDNTLVTLKHASGAFGVALENPTEPPPHKPTHMPSVNSDTETTPALNILRSLANACARELGAQVKIHDFAQGEVVYSESAAHRNGKPESVVNSDRKTISNCEASDFCSIADQDSRAKKQCTRFFGQKLENIRLGLQPDPRICICPMGLIVLSVPIKDPEDGMLYGAISCSPWIEDGTEGMVAESILRDTMSEQWEQFESASGAIAKFSPAKISLSQELLENVARDIAGLYSQMRRLKESRDQQRHLEKFIDETKHSLTHPLQGIGDRVLELEDRMRERSVSSVELEELVPDLKHYTQDAGDIVQRFTRASATTRQHYQFKPENIGDILTESITKFRIPAKRRNVVIKSKGLGSLGLVECDKAAMSELFDNLIENAIKFAHEHSEVMVAAVKSGADLNPPWEISGPGQRFGITDFGLGIATDELGHIFEPYFRGSVLPVGRVIRGTGIGLHRAKTIVDRHGGIIRPKVVPKYPERPPPEHLQNCLVTLEVDLLTTVPLELHKA